ncbi:MAG: glycine dehydrogenase, partial [Actinomycetota bacterium]
MNAALPPFARRHLGAGTEDLATMLATVGAPSMEALLAEAVPASILEHERLALPAGLSEAEALAELQRRSGENALRRSFIGLGLHGTLTPSVIRRNVLEDPGWYTAYTPYQPEIAQGRLEALLVFQTMVTDLVGREIAGASLLDEATAAAEGIQLCRRVSARTSGAVVVDHRCHPQTIAVVAGRLEPLGVELRVEDLRAARATALDDVVAVLLQSPDTDGVLHDDRELIGRAHAQGALVVVATDLLACTLVTPPGELDADVVVGSAQRFGVPLFAGGPHAAFLATREDWSRQLPGRLVGVSVDAKGRPAHRLALQTREQHIRRERATSNICTSQVLLAVVAAMYAVHHGPQGLTNIASEVHRRLLHLRSVARALGIEVVGEHHFDTITLVVPGRAAELLDGAVARGYELGRCPGPAGDLEAHDADRVRIALDETATDADVRALTELLVGLVADADGGGGGPTGIGMSEGAAPIPTHGPDLPGALVRTSTFLTDARFHRYRSETELMRWLRRLKDRDIALDRAMIPLGSCTMKLNAAVEMESVSWPAFAERHPFARADALAGTRSIVADLERWLATITGYDAVSLQPNAGSQGEFAGLLAIRGYHRANGAVHRDVCLIPSSAHGTNAASAVMAGMRVVVVGCDDRGNVDVDELAVLVERHRDELAALMVTYPSTHGVFEAEIGRICALVHDAGGQVYVDGANLNALVGIARPGRFGADVSHLNLHKTFAIPH